MQRFLFRNRTQCPKSKSLEVQMKAKSANRLSDEVRRKIEVRAYLIWEADGRPHGREKEHWQRAEAEISGAKPAKKASTAKKSGATKTAAPVKTKPVAKAKPPKTTHRER
jgi:hypothetical protein